MVEHLSNFIEFALFTLIGFSFGLLSLAIMRVQDTRTVRRLLFAAGCVCLLASIIAMWLLM